MGHSQTPGVALVASAAEDDWVARLVLAWLAAKRSENTRAAYARDIGVAPVRRTGRAPSWLGWCEASGVHPVTGVTRVDVARYARQLDAAGLAPASVARKLAAVSGWYDWLAQRGHISSSPATGLERPRVHPDNPAPSALTPDQALALVHAADSVQGPQRARTAALVAVLLFTGARVSEVIGADVEDLGTDQERPVLWVTRKHGLRQSLPLPGPAAARIGAYLDSRADLKDISAPPERSSPGARRALFATATGGRLFAADVWRAVRRAASRRPCRTIWRSTSDRTRCVSRSPGCTSTRAGRFATCRPRWGMPIRARPADTTGPGTPPAVRPATWSPPTWPPREARAGSRTWPA